MEKELGNGQRGYRQRLKGRSSHMNWKVSVEDGEDWAPDTGWFRFDWAD